MEKKKIEERRMVKFYPGDGYPIASTKIGRNELCQCGSGKKVKKCHGTVTKYFTTKKKEEKL